MTTTTNVPQVKLNIMTQQQYNSATKNPTELYMITDADAGQIIQVTTLPTASASELNNIYQYIGTTGTYTNGYFYKCVSDGAASPTYSWTQVNVQPAGGSLPSQTGNAGKFLTTDGTDASWGDALVNTATGTNAITIGGTASSYIGTVNIGSGSTGSIQSVSVGQDAKITGQYGVAIGRGTQANNYSIAVGYVAKANDWYSIQLGYGTNSVANTFKVGLSSNDNYTLLSSDGTIPTDRFTTTPVADGTYVPTLTISSGTATRSWGTGGSSYTAGTNMSISNNTISTSAAQVVIRRFS